LRVCMTDLLVGMAIAEGITCGFTKLKLEDRRVPTNKDASKKPSAKKRSLHLDAGKRASKGAPFNDQDPQRRLGNFNSAGEHSRQGGRSTGIVGQTKQKNKTDKKS
jgi:hypothetical protein